MKIKRLVSFLLIVCISLGIAWFPSTTGITAQATDNVYRYSALVLDVSPSMSNAAMTQMKKAAHKFAEQVLTADGQNYVAIIAYSYSAELICDFSENATDLSNAIDRVDRINRNGTNTYAGLSKAKNILSSSDIPSGAVKNVVLMTDGMANQSASTSDGPYTINDCDYYESSDYSYKYANSVYNLAEDIKKDGNIYTLGFFQDFTSFYPENIRPFAVKCLMDIASSHNYYYEVVKAEDLEFVFGDIADDIITDGVVSDDCPIIVIPGISGSELINLQGSLSPPQLVWLDFLNFFESTITLMGLDENGNSIWPTIACPDGYGTVDTYKKLIEGLKDKYGNDKVHFFAYDWRIDNADTAIRLKKFIDNLGVSKVDIVAHSMGGLVASRYIADGNGNKIRKLVTVGTPYLGSPKVPYVFSTGRLIEFLGISNSDIKGIGIAHNGIKKVAPHMATAYQLLPYNNVDPYIGIFDRKESKWYSITDTIHWNYVPANDFIKNTLNMTGINNERISSTVKGNFINKSIDFMKSINPGNVPAIKSVDSYVIVGTGKPTIHTTVYDSSGGFMYDFSFKNGDGTVPFWSASINETVSTYSFNYDHTKLVKAKKVIDQIIEILGSKNPANMSESAGGKPYVVVRVACPVDITVSHSGETLSSAANQFNNEAEFGNLYMIGENENIKILALAADFIFDIALRGTGTGMMDFDIRFYNATDDLIEERSFTDVPITNTTHIKTNTNRSEITTLFVDNTGNGVYDQIIYPDGYLPSYTITALAGTGGSVSGGGTFVSGTQVKLTATPNVGYTFDGWYEKGTKINGAEAIYSFTATANRTLEARFTPAKSATLNISEASFDKSAPKDIAVTLYENDYTFRNIQIGNSTLVQGWDYYVNGNIYTIKSDYLLKLADGKAMLTFDMSGGINPILTITIETSVKEPEGPVPSMGNFVKTTTYKSGMFTDVDENQWYGFKQDKVIASAYEYGLMKGNSSTTFNPTGNITIAEAITVASRVHSIYMTGEENFALGSPWYQTYVDYAVANGIINFGDFTNYDRAATRAEMAYIFSRSLPATEFAAQNTVYSLPDVNSSTKYYNAILTLYKAGVVTGNDSAGTFKPTANITRAEAAAIISRVILPYTRVSGKTY